MNNNTYPKYEAKFKKLFDKTVKSPQIFTSSMHIENEDGSYSYFLGHGDRDMHSPMILASISKLFTTTCILNLIQQGKLSFSDKLSKFFPKEIINSLHIYKGNDYSYDITVKHLLFQATGFPDIFAVGKPCLNKQYFSHGDFYSSFEDYIKLTKDYKKKFAPGTPKKAHYSDMNFEFLGKIIEKIEEISLHEAYKKYVFIPLGMTNTYYPEKDEDFVPTTYYKESAIERPLLIRSLPACGGCISTSRETMKFLKAFFNGALFDKAIFLELREFATIQYAPPLGQYGGGFVRLNISGIASMFRLRGELIGHMGGSGAYAYYYPEKGLYFVGDVNQLAAPSKIFTIPAKLADIVSK